jgi:hypothetical protein
MPDFSQYPTSHARIGAAVRYWLATYKEFDEDGPTPDADQCCEADMILDKVLREEGRLHDLDVIERILVVADGVTLDDGVWLELSSGKEFHISALTGDMRPA